MNGSINQFLSALVYLSLSLSLSIEGDYLELSQFPYNSHQFPYNSYPSPLGTSRFLTSDLIFSKSLVLSFRAYSSCYSISKP